MSATDIPLNATSRSAAVTPSAVQEEARFESVVAPLIPDLVRYFARRVQPTADAADCAAETTLAMWRHRAKLPSVPDEQRAWAFGIARNILANHTRKRVRRSIIDETVRSTLPQTPPEISDESYAALQALGLLKESDRELIRLIIWDGFSIAEAGQVLGLRAEAARKRYERARHRLRDHMQTIWGPVDETADAGQVQSRTTSNLEAP